MRAIIAAGVMILAVVCGPSRQIEGNATSAVAAPQSRDVDLKTEFANARRLAGGTVPVLSRMTRDEATQKLGPSTYKVEFEGDQAFDGKLSSGVYFRLVYSKVCDPMFKARPSLIYLFPADLTPTRELPKVGLDAAKVRTVDYMMRDGKKGKGSSKRYAGIDHYQFKERGSHGLFFIEDNWQGP